MRTIIYIVGMFITEAIYITNGMEFEFVKSDTMFILFVVAVVLDILYLFKD